MREGKKKKKAIISQMESLKKNDAWIHIINIINDNILILKEAVWNDVGKDFDKSYTINDIRKLNAKLLDMIKEIPDTVILENSEYDDIDNGSIGYGDI